MKKIMLAALTASMVMTMGCSNLNKEFVKIPGKNFKMLKTEVTQKLYESVMGENPSGFKGENNPVEQVNFYDLIYFCNKLSLSEKKTPVYAVDGEVDVTKWNYTPHNEEEIEGKITQNLKADGFRLPTLEEWQYAAKGGEEYTYAGSDDLDEVGWYKENCDGATQIVAQKKPNAYGLYDMSGNVWEWASNGSFGVSNFFACGGGTVSDGRYCRPDSLLEPEATLSANLLGFRLTFTSKKTKSSKPKMEFVKIPGKDFKMLKTEVTQKLYESVMGQNPSYFSGENNPVEMVSWYDAIYFCNKLSKKNGKKPVYAVNGETDVTKWSYTPHNEDEIEGKITRNLKANGFSLPTLDEWQYAAMGGENYKYAGSDDLGEVAWYDKNSNDETHSVAQKKPNAYGLYDMSGNVWEWCWDSYESKYGIISRYFCGGSYYDDIYDCEDGLDPDYCDDNIGFRIVCPK